MLAMCHVELDIVIWRVIHQYPDSKISEIDILKLYFKILV